jgi:hypothetical protein
MICSGKVSLLKESLFIKSDSLSKLTFPEQIIFTPMKNGHGNGDPWVLSEKLGSGATADVYMARECYMPFKMVGAMKIFKEEQRFVKLAVKEAQSLLKVNHPNSVRILAHGNKGHLNNCITLK